MARKFMFNPRRSNSGPQLAASGANSVGGMPWCKLGPEGNTMSDAPPVVLSIAGFDPSSGAGVTADIKTIAAHGCYGVAALTALTVQSTSGVRRCEAADPAMLRDCLHELKQDTKISAVH